MVKEYLKLLAQRESKVVLGKYYSNMWILAIVFIATFVSIAFSNGSMIYLEEKMNDPFTNWVDIPKDNENSNFDRFKSVLEDEEICKQFSIKRVQYDYYLSLNIFNRENNSTHYLRCRYFGDMDSTEIVNAILAEDNIVNDCRIDRSVQINNSLGVIMTADAIQRLGYSTDSLPTYVNYCAANMFADSLFGVTLHNGKYLPMPLPVLAVVKRLPSNLDFIASSRLYNDISNQVFELKSHPEYLENILFSVKSGYEETFKQKLKEIDVPEGVPAMTIYPAVKGSHSNIKNWRNDELFQIYFGYDKLPDSFYIDICNKITATCDAEAVKRVYGYVENKTYPGAGEFLSVTFSSLDAIRAFEKFAKDNYDVRIDMSLVNSKENFNAVSVMANILSWAMIIFSIICIVMFIVNMLQSYFQKVKRNMGTFKAFGINSSELIRVYVFIMLAIVVVAILMALAVSWMAELTMPIFGFVREGGFNYLSLWNEKTMWSIGIIVLCTVVTVCLVMSKLLKQTPGDLIYDR